MARVDYRLTEDNEDQILNGDWAFDEADDDNVDLIITLPQGHIRHQPLTGIGFNNQLNGIFLDVVKKDMSDQITDDGYYVDLIYKDPNTDEIVIDFQ